MSSSAARSQAALASTATMSKSLGGAVTEIVNVAVDADGRAGPYYPGDAKCVTLVATAACEFQARGGGSPGPANTVYRDLIIGGSHQSATATKCGYMIGGSIPYEFYIHDTASSGSNPCTLYITY